MTTLDTRIKQSIRDIPDFPKPGIIFKDITPVVADPPLFRDVIAAFADRYQGKGLTTIIGIESRGFIFGSALAHKMGLPFHLVRKKGKLPYKTIQTSYDLEYGSATIEMHVDAITPTDVVLVVDDLLATGGTAAAACELVSRQGGRVHECAFMVELDFLNGRKLLKDTPVFSLVHY
ncbi:MAG: adenine phosphoribosyltransferase [Deltaproteobacteria bacterium CG11_big_fil_rev_8_21_14_0_20_47_16]|nr:MAG: adenine phosphoribosyltransferase [Deltaproteobacteria bacterium CG11_big_fil_rev_8_21_14_0_20_47_16]